MALPTREITARETTHDKRALISPRADFWLIGGLSVAFAALLVAASGVGLVAPDLEDNLLEVAGLASVLSLLVNHPHFVASYRLAYGREREFIGRHWLELIAVPAVLVLLAMAALASWSAELGVPLVDGQGQLMQLLAVVMFISVGWHYVKQTYGCVRLMSVFDGYELTGRQLDVIRLGLFPLWFGTLLRFSGVRPELGGLGYGWASAPWLLSALVWVLSWGGLAAIAWVFVETWRRTGEMPTARVVVPIVALVVWWAPQLSVGLYLPLVPFFHSLQYLPFVAKIESTGARRRQSDPAARWLGLLAVAVGLILAGRLVFVNLPKAADVALGSLDASGLPKVTIAVAIVVNVHHYFIDHVIWRVGQDTRTRDLLMA